MIKFCVKTPGIKRPVSLQWKILFPILGIIVLLLMAILLLSQFLLGQYILNCIEGEMESISIAARDVIEREYIYNEQLSTYQNDIYLLAQRLVKNLNELPRRIITTDYDLRFVVKTEEATLHFVTAQMINDATEMELAEEITGRIMEEFYSQKIEPEKIYSHPLFINNVQYFAMCIPLNLKSTFGKKEGYLISYVNTNSQYTIQESLNGGLTIITLGALLIAVFISWYITRRLSRPLNRLCQYAETIGQLEFCQQEINSGIREVDELAVEMNRMAHRLAEYDENQKKFLLNISHDLRTPLTSIEGYAECICYDVTDDPKQSATTILKESHHLKQMVEDLLFMSRMDMAEDRVPSEILDLTQELREIRERMNGQALERGCTIQCLLPDTPVLIWGDESHLSRALMNVLSNALRYAETTVQMILTLENGQAVLEIQDDGPGFSPEDIPKIFDRFYKGKGGNFGVGMSIVQMILHDMNGTVSADNHPDGGAVVTICLPLYEAPEEKTEDPA